MRKILVADSISPLAIDELKKVSEFEVNVKTGMNEEELVKTIPPFDGIIVRSATKVTSRVIDAAENLKIIVRAGIGLDNIDLEAAEKKGIKVTNTPAATTISVAELTMGLMLSAVRNIAQANMSMKNHKWEKKLFMGTELYEKTLGIVGFGRIGKEVARRALAFGMKILVYDIIKIETDLDVKQVSFEELLSNSDIITLHIPLTEDTRHIISEKEFNLMKDGVILINIARGGVVDEKALLNALNSGKVKTAAIDVWEKEPTDNFELVDHPNVIALPHLGASAKEGQARAGLEAVKILKENLL
ncbi:NAD(P)-binding domain-containing protein [Candidatus Aminicenantes bacterium AC-708-M15]|jgi:D-3-phosphoglycerate dehydrogenase|nr:NAD(P)-binding domain-containing protein [SCandidatus Aminicenantes bacterium Aminicenantia_JdfR_composite]MCP2597438.1 NAD(P)-binding domain-containing protein [Candidatus Aminicenantes bacterium AC-335-G13]MCP2598622.1 NAD(P)-binding domain-containing protein [Candidatus Aminicenantes bacterium AC-335-L06]MCP2604380.1 NAD(P)-binding domain-containing protein [Candidatus Aminicenantes bacterium AC-708-M15]MCP2618743.1 NAD(P)-binding domain-containing protein [Candidatus Aminicenantes bacter